VKNNCLQCPRQCGVDRESTLGYCLAPWHFSVSRASLHMWEEPSVSGTRGSGTIFFSGCNLRCVYCQNRDISHAAVGKLLDGDGLAALFFKLRDAGAHNVNLVTPTPYAFQLADVLERVKPSLGIPVVYNCGGYESVETLKRLDGLVDVYLPDLKYFDTDLAARYSDAPDYFPTALSALREMLRQAGKPQLDGDGIMGRGVIVRHLVLTSHRSDSIALLGRLATEFGTSAFLLSLMSQYTPDFAQNTPYPALHRRVTSFEYNSVLSHAQSLGFDGYFQSRTAATSDFTPDFHDTGLL
jgi:putative pyruvate formate lyase activating enzyme